jgi:hypothetical protein
MSLRSFTVFQDTPASETNNPKALVPEQSSSSLASVNPYTALSSLASIADKENLHPITGELTIPGASKKRKTCVLATKSSLPLATKKQPDSSESKPEPKKRKPSSSTKGKLAPKKEKRTSAGKKTGKSSSCKPSPLPRLEEVGESEKEAERLTRADVDSRCYELTVMPLADVTQAYGQVQDQSSVSKYELVADKQKFSSVKVCLFTGFISCFLIVAAGTVRRA